MITKMKLSKRNEVKIHNSLYYTVNRLLQEFKGELFLAGGAMSTIFSHLPSSDYDLFYLGNDFDKFTTEKLLMSPTVMWYDRKYRKDNKVLNLTLGKNAFSKLQIIQLDNCNTPEKILDNFDMFQCMIGWDGEHMFADRIGLRAAMKKEIKIAKVEYPLIAMKRLLKYRDKGYSLSDKNMVDFLEKVHVRLLTHNLNDPNSDVQNLWKPYIGANDD